MLKIKYKSNLFGLSTINNGDLLAPLAIPGTKVIHGIPTVCPAETPCSIQLLGLRGADKKLGLLCAGSASAMDKIVGPVGVHKADSLTLYYLPGIDYTHHSLRLS